MRPPDSYAGLTALVLGALGAVFALLGLVGEAPPPASVCWRRGGGCGARSWT